MMGMVCTERLKNLRNITTTIVSVFDHIFRGRTEENDMPGSLNRTTRASIVNLSLQVIHTTPQFCLLALCSVAAVP